ncbi:uncharacterized protein SAPINGB_P003883 [Magnusiomyces paraingens]|uniref:Uncharacterized protein n=1 Tax=Magnusiomyces paraingens TaxID=2606893 RepID=A0A5E8BRR6_9ASCO|nr:uncharacterized protein SAPINGB_P003883 [Saprochaete ingens]VVT54053.1 unnamed protein product [Saprochaete ingens]
MNLNELLELDNLICTVLIHKYRGSNIEAVTIAGSSAQQAVLFTTWRSHTISYFHEEFQFTSENFPFLNLLLSFQQPNPLPHYYYNHYYHHHLHQLENQMYPLFMRYLALTLHGPQTQTVVDAACKYAAQAPLGFKCAHVFRYLEEHYLGSLMRPGVEKEEEENDDDDDNDNDNHDNHDNDNDETSDCESLKKTVTTDFEKIQQVVMPGTGVIGWLRRVLEQWRRMSNRINSTIDLRQLMFNLLFSKRVYKDLNLVQNHYYTGYNNGYTTPHNLGNELVCMYR